MVSEWFFLVLKYKFVAIYSYSGLLKVWNYETKTVVVSRKFDKGLLIRCVQYDPKGQFIGEYRALFMSSGNLSVLNIM